MNSQLWLAFLDLPKNRSDTVRCHTRRLADGRCCSAGAHRGEARATDPPVERRLLLQKPIPTLRQFGRARLRFRTEPAGEVEPFQDHFVSHHPEIGPTPVRRRAEFGIGKQQEGHFRQIVPRDRRKEMMGQMMVGVQRREEPALIPGPVHVPRRRVPSPGSPKCSPNDRIPMSRGATVVNGSNHSRRN